MSDFVTVTPVSLEDADKRKYAFMPQSDMTALESALIAQLFVKMILNTWKGDKLDWQGYLDDHKLWRHFVSDQMAQARAVVSADPMGTKVIKDPEGRMLRVTEDMLVPEGYTLMTDEDLKAAE